MPIYEYACRACGHKFEEFVRGEVTPVCPSCKGQDLERLLSMFAVSSEATSQAALKGAHRTNNKMLHDQKVADDEFIRNHQH